jgi:hypothetical protein
LRITFNLVASEVEELDNQVAVAFRKSFLSRVGRTGPVAGVPLVSTVCDVHDYPNVKAEAQEADPWQDYVQEKQNETHTEGDPKLRGVELIGVQPRPDPKKNCKENRAGLALRGWAIDRLRLLVNRLRRRLLN